MIIAYDNEVFNATITASSEHPDYDFDTALNDTVLAKKGRTIGDVTQWVKFAMSTAVDVDYVFVLNNNLSSGATIKIQANISDSWASPAIDQALTLVGDRYYYKFSSTQSYQYWRLYIDDPLNPDGYIELSYVYLGDYLHLSRMDRSKSVPRRSNSIVDYSEGGQVYGSIKRQYREAKISIPLIEHATKLLADTWFQTCDIVTPFIMVIWEDDIDTEGIIYCTLTKPLDWKQVETENTILYWSLDLEFREVF